MKIIFLIAVDKKSLDYNDYKALEMIRLSYYVHTKKTKLCYNFFQQEQDLTF